MVGWVMGWFGPSTTDRMMDLLREERKSREASETRMVALAEKLIDAATEHAKLGEKYLNLFTTPTTTSVRLMTDADEVVHEQKRRANGTVTASPLPVDFRPEEWFADLKAGMLNE